MAMDQGIIDLILTQISKKIQCSAPDCLYQKRNYYAIRNETKIKALSHEPLGGEFTCHRWIPIMKNSNEQIVCHDVIMKFTNTDS